MFDIWCDLMRRHPDTALWFVGLPADTADNLRREARARGVDPARLVFGPKLPAADHWARYRVADLLLDTFPCGGHTTLSDALWHGCPTVALAGRGFHTRVGASLLRAAGLDELVAADPAEYAAKLDRLLADPDALPRWRARIEAGRDNSALFDTPRFVAELESAYQTMAAASRAGRPVRAFDVAPGG